MSFSTFLSRTQFELDYGSAIKSQKEPCSSA